MGMDVYGNNGNYFRNNVWWWRALWNYCCDIGFEIIPPDVKRSGHSNDGSGLNAKDSITLAKMLIKEIESGNTKKYEDEYMAKINALPDEDCRICGGTGLRAAAPNTGPGEFGCNGCGGDFYNNKPGKGKVRPWASHYPFNVENVKEFADFLMKCGGFRIC